MTEQTFQLPVDRTQYEIIDPALVGKISLAVPDSSATWIVISARRELSSAEALVNDAKPGESVITLLTDNAGKQIIVTAILGLTDKEAPEYISSAAINIAEGVYTYLWAKVRDIVLSQNPAEQRPNQLEMQLTEELNRYLVTAGSHLVGIFAHHFVESDFSIHVPMITDAMPEQNNLHILPAYIGNLAQKRITSS